MANTTTRPINVTHWDDNRANRTLILCIIAIFVSGAWCRLILQFTWMGVAINAVVSRQAPPIMTMVSVVVVLIGTVLATGLLNSSGIVFHWLGVLLGLCAALSNAIRVYVSGALAVKTDL